jgi:predicted peptidase
MFRILLAFFLTLFACGAVLAQKPTLEDLLEKHTFTSGKASLSYRLLKPATIEEKKSYPLVIFLHGAGERGSDNKAQLKHGVAEFAKETMRKKHPCFLIAPQCPTRGSWANIDFRAKTHAMSKEPSEPGRLVLELIEKTCKDHPIDKKRIYLTGLSMGGYGTWDLLSRKPDLFAAGIPICGGGDEGQARTLAKIPIWAFHGDKDFAVRVERSRTMIDAIKKAGGKPRYTEYPGVGHDSWTQTYRNQEVLNWLFEQRRE